MPTFSATTRRSLRAAARRRPRTKDGRFKKGSKQLRLTKSKRARTKTGRFKKGATRRR